MRTTRRTLGVSQLGDDVMLWQQFFSDDRGQDLVEYSLLLAFVCLVGAATFIGMGQTIGGIWGIANNRLASANCTSNCSGS
jgi:Flp pilus assembly pilin Flp